MDKDIFQDLNHKLLADPYLVEGEVIKGFGRGSKELGIPTANFPESVVSRIPEYFSAGVYYGWARVGNGPVYKMVLSVGWNPFYKNQKKSMETHIIHKFDEDFYGTVLRVVLTGYIRPELNFTSVENLIVAIKNDISVASSQLDKSEHLEHKSIKFISRKI